MTCARCGCPDHTVKDCSWPTDTDDEPIKVPYIPPVYEDDDYSDDFM
jgi:hypothetical protein